MESSDRKRFKVAKAKMKTEDGHYIERWLITDNLVPLYALNEWVDAKSLRKASTGKEYASKLSTYLNYLDMIGKTYDKADNNDVTAFLLYSIYGDRDDLAIRSLAAQISYSTLSKYISTGYDFGHHKSADKKQRDNA